MATGRFTAVLHKEGELYVAECPEVGTVSQGSMLDEAVANLREATELYLEGFPLAAPARPGTGRSCLSSQEFGYMCLRISCGGRYHFKKGNGPIGSSRVQHFRCARGITRTLIVLCLALFFICSTSFADDDFVSGLTVISLRNGMARLSWDAVVTEECVSSVTYSVFRSTTSTFEPSDRTRIVLGIPKTSFVGKESAGVRAYYYYVTAQVEAASCQLSSGAADISRLDLGGNYDATIGDESVTCKAISVFEVGCSGKQYYHFHAALASQDDHDYLIVCPTQDFEEGNWSCVNLPEARFRIYVHSKTLTILNGGFSEVNTKTGKSIRPLTPVFSIIARLN